MLPFSIMANNANLDRLLELRSWVASHARPVLAIHSTPAAKALYASAGCAFAATSMARHAAQTSLNVPIRTASGEPIRVRDFAVRMHDISDVDSATASPPLDLRRASAAEAEATLANAAADAEAAEDAPCTQPRPGPALALAKGVIAAEHVRDPSGVATVLPVTWQSKLERAVSISLQHDPLSGLDRPVCVIVVLAAEDVGDVRNVANVVGKAMRARFGLGATTSPFGAATQNDPGNGSVLMQFAVVASTAKGDTAADDAMNRLHATFGRGSCATVVPGDDESHGAFMRNHVVSTLLPYLESKARALHHHISNARRGLRNQLRALWSGRSTGASDADDAHDAAGGGNGGTSPGGAATGAANSSESHLYAIGTVERVIADACDLSLMLGDAEQATAHAKALMGDARTDRRYFEYARASERCGMARLLAWTPVEVPASTSASPTMADGAHMRELAARSAASALLRLREAESNFRDAQTAYARLSLPRWSTRTALLLNRTLRCHAGGGDSRTYEGATPWNGMVMRGTVAVPCDDIASDGGAAASAAGDGALVTDAEASAALVRASYDEVPLVAGMLLEASARGSIDGPPTSVEATAMSPRGPAWRSHAMNTKKSAFHLVLAGHRYSQGSCFTRAARCHTIALQHYESVDVPYGSSRWQGGAVRMDRLRGMSCRFASLEAGFARRRAGAARADDESADALTAESTSAAMAAWEFARDVAGTEPPGLAEDHDTGFRRVAAVSASQSLSPHPTNATAVSELLECAISARVRGCLAAHRRWGFARDHLMSSLARLTVALGKHGVVATTSHVQDASPLVQMAGVYYLSVLLSTTGFVSEHIGPDTSGFGSASTPSGAAAATPVAPPASSERAHGGLWDELAEACRSSREACGASGDGGIPFISSLSVPLFDAVSVELTCRGVVASICDGEDGVPSPSATDSWDAVSAALGQPAGELTAATRACGPLALAIDPSGGSAGGDSDATSRSASTNWLDASGVQLEKQWGSTESASFDAGTSAGGASTSGDASPSITRGWSAHASACADEVVTVSVSVYNPLTVAVTLGRILPRLEILAEDHGSGSAIGECEPVGSVTLPPKGRHRLTLRVACKRRGLLRVRGIAYTLARGDVEFAASYASFVTLPGCEGTRVAAAGDRVEDILAYVERCKENPRAAAAACARAGIPICAFVDAPGCMDAPSSCHELSAWQASLVSRADAEAAALAAEASRVADAAQGSLAARRRKPNDAVQARRDDEVRARLRHLTVRVVDGSPRVAVTLDVSADAASDGEVRVGSFRLTNVGNSPVTSLRLAWAPFEMLVPLGADGESPETSISRFANADGVAAGALLLEDDKLDAGASREIPVVAHLSASSSCLQAAVAYTGAPSSGFVSRTSLVTRAWELALTSISATVTPLVAGPGGTGPRVLHVDITKREGGAGEAAMAADFDVHSVWLASGDTCASSSGVTGVPCTLPADGSTSLVAVCGDVDGERPKQDQPQPRNDSCLVKHFVRARCTKDGDDVLHAVQWRSGTRSGCTLAVARPAAL